MTIELTMKTPILIFYLDFDGCLHGEDVRIVKQRPVIFENNVISERPLFEHVPLLERLVMPHPELRIVLSTSWVRHLGFSYAKAQLTPALRARIVGATWNPSLADEPGGAEYYDRLSRYQVICEDAARRKCDRWLALDDDIDCWPESQYHRVVVPEHRLLALGQLGKADELATALQRLCT